MERIDKFTSTGAKFWYHPDAMHNYRYTTGHSVITTHIAPEGACNLKCPYCSVTHRKTHNRIPLYVIKDYVDKLVTRGLQGVILTGGGEPTAYKEFNELCEWLLERSLKIGLITNGTLSGKVNEELWDEFSWVRVSINFFPGWKSRIELPKKRDGSQTVRGCSMVFTQDHEQPEALHVGWEQLWKDVSGLADKLQAEYIRVLPNCLQPQDDLKVSHGRLDAALKFTTDPRYLHQVKLHREPNCSTCHQSFFRPYLSEAAWHEDGTPGSVYPCDSVVLDPENEDGWGHAQFKPKYQLCKPGSILDYLDGKIKPNFRPNEDCKGCVFTDNVEMLDDWKNDNCQHREFV